MSPLDQADLRLASRGMARVLQTLVQAGDLSAANLAQAQQLARRRQVPIDAALHDLGLVPARRLLQVLSAVTGLPVNQAADTPVDPELVRRLPRREAERWGAVPLSDDGRRLRLALVDPFDPALDDRLATLFKGRQIAKQLVTRDALADLLNAAWGTEPDFSRMEALLDGAGGALHLPPADLQSARSPLARLLDDLLGHAVARGASDLHLDPGEHLFRIRMRVDGLMRDVHSIKMVHWLPVINRLKILAEMDIGRHMDAQHGQFSMSLHHRRVTFRAAILPSLYGESMVLRLLDRRHGADGLGDLAVTPTTRARLERMLARPDGLVLVTGPIASGKTTTAAALLRTLAAAQRCIVTLEDPVEVHIHGARQVPVHAERAWGFGELMRHVLRQDADVVFLGEIRDAGSAGVTVATAMIGKRVLATLHARDAVAAITRMLLLEVDAGGLAEALVAVTNQRLLPRLCLSCRTPDKAAAAGPFVAPGCPACHGTGISGRAPVMEVLLIDDPMRDAIARRDLRALRQAAAADLHGQDLQAAALELVAGGVVGLRDAAAQLTLQAKALP
ncbi:GspE/PulE family protein [Polaromonas sp.]|uniref:GspE/PulE family protein n=1 Tax=Polaromonas sp. TaxID=1869339 RepID=UPI003569EE0D